MKIRINKVEDLGKFAEEMSRNELLKKSREGSICFTILLILGFVTTLVNTGLGLLLVLSGIACLVQAKYMAIIAYLKKLKEEKK